MRSPELTLSDGTVVRFCYGHRVLEPLERFKGEQTRCMSALNELRRKRGLKRERMMLDEQRQKDSESDASTLPEGSSVSGKSAASAPEEPERVERPEATSEEARFQFARRTQGSLKNLVAIHCTKKRSRTDSFGNGDASEPPENVSWSKTISGYGALDAEQQTMETPHLNSAVHRSQLRHSITLSPPCSVLDLDAAGLPLPRVVELAHNMSESNVAYKVPGNLSTRLVRNLVHEAGIAEAANRRLPPSVPHEAESSEGHHPEVGPSNDFVDMWLTPGSVVMHSFTFAPVASQPTIDGDDCTTDTLEELSARAKALAAGNVFSICDENAGQRRSAELPVFLSKDGLTVRVLRDGSFTIEREIDPDFRRRALLSCHVAVSSPSTRTADFNLQRVPHGVKFEARFHGSTLLHVEELCRTEIEPSTAATGFSSSRETGLDDVRLRVHLPQCLVGVVRLEAVWSEGPCRNMIAGAGFPILLLPDERLADEFKRRVLRPRGGANNEDEALGSSFGGDSSAPMSPVAARRFLQFAGYTLHDALSGNQRVVGHLGRLHAAAEALLMPLTCALTRDAADALDTALLAQADDERDAQIRLEELNHDECVSSSIGKMTWSAKTGAKGRDNESKPYLRLAGATRIGLSVMFTCTALLWRYMTTLRPGSSLLAIFLVCRQMGNIEVAAKYIIGQIILDLFMIPRKAFPWVSPRGSARYKNEDDWYRTKWMKVASFQLAFLWLAYNLHPEDHALQRIVSAVVCKPWSRDGCFLKIATMYARLKSAYDEPYVELKRNNMLRFLFLNWLSTVLIIVLQVGTIILAKNGHTVYTGDNAVPTLLQCALHYAFWLAGMLLTALLGNWMRNHSRSCSASELKKCA